MEDLLQPLLKAVNVVVDQSLLGQILLIHDAHQRDETIEDFGLRSLLPDLAKHQIGVVAVRLRGC